MASDDSLVKRLLERCIADVGTHALVLLEPSGIVVGWYAGAERMFGYSPDEILGKSAAVLFTPEDLCNDMFNWEIQTAIGSGESEDDRWHLRKDGGRIWVCGILTALIDEAGNVLGFAKIMRNRSDMKSQVETLERRVASLQHVAKNKDVFISTLAHELRNPLATISYAQHALTMLGDHTHSESPIFEMTATIKRQVEFMQRMIVDLLEATSTATGKVELRREAIVLQDVIRWSLESTRISVASRQQTLNQFVTAVPITLKADPLCLRQVFCNLIENAAKYTPSGGMIAVKVSVEGDEAVVRIQDTGNGIAPEVMPHIFDLFTQVETNRDNASGLGIGLSVVKDKIGLHGGSIQATSDGLGKGSEFTVRLPLVLEDEL